MCVCVYDVCVWLCMNASMYACVCVCVWCVTDCRESGFHVYTYGLICMYILWKCCKHIHTQIHTYINWSAPAKAGSTYTRTFSSVCMYVCTYVCIRVSMCLHYIHIYIYIYIYIYRHTDISVCRHTTHNMKLCHSLCVRMHLSTHA
jgi:hypothetical protein